MSKEQENERFRIFGLFRAFDKVCAKIDFVIVPVNVVVGVAVGFIQPLLGVGVAVGMLFLSWIYFDAKKHRGGQKSRNVKDRER